MEIIKSTDEERSRGWQVSVDQLKTIQQEVKGYSTASRMDLGDIQKVLLAIDSLQEKGVI